MPIGDKGVFTNQVTPFLHSPWFVCEEGVIECLGDVVWLSRQAIPLAPSNLSPLVECVLRLRSILTKCNYAGATHKIVHSPSALRVRRDPRSMCLDECPHFPCKGGCLWGVYESCQDAGIKPPEKSGELAQLLLFLR